MVGPASTQATTTSAFAVMVSRAITVRKMLMTVFHSRATIVANVSTVSTGSCVNALLDLLVQTAELMSTSVLQIHVVMGELA